MQKIAGIYLTAFLLITACSKPNELNKLREVSTKIKKETPQYEKFKNLPKEEQLRIKGLYLGGNHCFDCDYDWNENTDPNLY